MVEIRGDKKVLVTPVSREDLEDIKIGDIVWLDGDLMTCRDVAHRRLVEYGRELPYDIKDKAIFHAGPSVRKIEGNLMKNIQQETGTAYLLITHDLSMVKYISDRIGVLHLGHLLETGTTEYEVYR